MGLKISSLLLSLSLSLRLYLLTLITLTLYLYIIYKLIKKSLQNLLRVKFKSLQSCGVFGNGRVEFLVLLPVCLLKYLCKIICLSQPLSHSMFPVFYHCDVIYNVCLHGVHILGVNMCILKFCLIVNQTKAKTKSVGITRKHTAVGFEFTFCYLT